MRNKKKGWFKSLIDKFEDEPQDVRAGFMHMLEPNMQAKLVTIREMTSTIDRLENSVLEEDRDEEDKCMAKLSMLFSIMGNNMERDDTA